MTSSWLLSRVVELTGTYLVQSTVILCGAWGLLSLWKLMNDWKHSRSRSQPFPSPKGNPHLAERVWKTAAILGMLTAPVSVFSGWSHSAWKWSFHEQSVLEIVSESQDLVRSEGNVTHNQKRFRNPRTIQSDDPELTVSRNRLSDPEIDVVYVLPMSPISSALTIGNDKRIQQENGDVASSEPSIIPSPSIESPVQERSQSESTPDGSVRGSSIRFWVHGIGVAILVWFGGTLFRLAMRILSLHRLLARCVPIDGAILRELQNLTSGRCRIRLLRSRAVTPSVIEKHRWDCVTEPFACGVFRWTIVLPDWIERELSPAERKALLAHEVAHLIRRDPLWLMIGEILCACLAFQPLNFLARRRWQRATELICDDWAVERHVSSTSLANCIARIAELRLTGRTTALGLTAVGDAGALTHRIEWLLRCEREAQPKRRHGRVFATMLTFAAGILVSVNGPHLSLVFSAEAGDEFEEIAVWDRMENDMTEILNQLTLIESQLSGDVEAAPLAESLRVRAAELKQRLSR